MQVKFIRKTAQRVLAHRLLGRSARNALIGVSGGLASSLVGLAYTSCLAKALEIESYGRLLIVFNFYQFVHLFLGLRLKDFIYSEYTKPSQANGSREKATLLGAAFWCALGSGILITVIAASLSHGVAIWLYEDRAYLLPLLAYSVFLLGKPLEDMSGAILRVHDRYASAIVPQVSGRLLSLLATAPYVLLSSDPKLWVICLMGASGWLYTSVAPVRAVWKYVCLEDGQRIPLWQWSYLVENRRRLLRCLGGTNLVGLLKTGSDVGGMFLLGVFGDTSQAAIFGFAIHLTRPFVGVENNINGALAPEVIKLARSAAYRDLRKLATFAGLASLALLAIAIPLVHVCLPFIISYLATDSLVSAACVVSILLACSALRVSAIMYYPLALTLGRIGSRNWTVAFASLAIPVAIAISPTAISVALAVLFMTVAVRIFNDYPIYLYVKERATIGV